MDVLQLLSSRGDSGLSHSYGREATRRSREDPLLKSARSLIQVRVEGRVLEARTRLEVQVIEKATSTGRGLVTYVARTEMRHVIS